MIRYSIPDYLKELLGHKSPSYIPLGITSADSVVDTDALHIPEAPLDITWPIAIRNDLRGLNRNSLGHQLSKDAGTKTNFANSIGRSEAEQERRRLKFKRGEKKQK